MNWVNPISILFEEHKYYGVLSYDEQHVVMCEYNLCRPGRWYSYWISPGGWELFIYDVDLEVIQ